MTINGAPLRAHLVRGWMAYTYEGNQGLKRAGIPNRDRCYSCARHAYNAESRDCDLVRQMVIVYTSRRPSLV